MSSRPTTPVKPYATDGDKKQQVAEMFDNIAHRYDFLNRLLSLGIDNYWRWYAIEQLKLLNPKKILDVATGTADLAIAALRLKPEQIIGVDISNQMLDKGRDKIKAKKYDDVIELRYGDSENLGFESNTFDALTVAFGVRNFGDLEAGLAEMRRVIRPGGMAAILEFSKPTAFPVKQTFGFYFKYLLPFVGKYFSSDERAYTYLPESVAAFPEGDDFVRILTKTGFKNTRCIPLTFGICSLYLGTKD